MAFQEAWFGCNIQESELERSVGTWVVNLLLIPRKILKGINWQVVYKQLWNHHKVPVIFFVTFLEG